MGVIAFNSLVADERPLAIDCRGADQLAAVGFAEWVAMYAATTSLPRLMLELALSSRGDRALIVYAGFKLLETALGLYLLIWLRSLLNGRSTFHSANSALVWWIGFGAFSCALNGVMPGWSGRSIGLLGLSLGMTAGAAVDVCLGMVLLRLKDDPHGCVNAYAFSHIISGVCIATIALF